jgi:putative ATPase
VAQDLFSKAAVFEPLAARMRPISLDNYYGQQHLLAPDKPLRKAIDAGQIHSMIFWGPPGVGKTTLARLLAHKVDAHFEVISAVLSGVKEIRLAIESAKLQQLQYARKTILFVDEVHRFNKSQEDAFLPYVEDGTVIFVGATTENPSFELNNALLSRARVYVLKSIEAPELERLIDAALINKDEGLGSRNLVIEDQARSELALAADGDARRALNLLEIAADLEEGGSITFASIEQVLQDSPKRFDKGGDVFYEQISALHKSVRGSSADGALYWLCRMLDAGCDPLYVARRIVRMASEEIGNADPRALQIALSAWDTQERLGSPEGELAIAQAVVYLACAPKSNAVYAAFNQVRADIRQQPSHEVPEHLRNAPTKLMKEMGYGGEYRYAHDEPEAYAAGENYMPEALKDTRYYEPTNRGLESKIQQKFEYLNKLDEVSSNKRYPPL